MSRWIKRILIAIALIALVVILRRTFFRPEPVPVTVFVATRGRVEETVTNSKAGTVKSRHRAKLSPEIGGRVVEIRARKGETVRAGDVLIRLDDTQYRAQEALAGRALDAARSGEVQACLSSEMAARDLARTEGLAREKLVSDQVLDQARNGREVARSTCDAARAHTSQLAAQLQVVRAELAKTVLRAPFDGIVAELTTEQGEWITPSPPGIPMPAVLDLIDQASTYVSAPLDEIDLGRVTVGLPVRITMDSFTGKSFAGHVARIAPYIVDVASESRTFEVEAGFDDQAFARRLPPGASGDIEVVLSAHDNVLRVPAYAILEGKRVLALESACSGETTFLGRLTGWLRAERGDCLVTKPVTAGLKNWEFAEIVSGLSEGDRVVVSLDRAEVKEGARAVQTATALK